MLDASALVVVMLSEAGGDAVHAVLAQTQIGAVNLSVVVAKLRQRGVPDDVIDMSVADLDLAVVPFDRNQVVRACRLRVAKRSAGLSLDVRTCLATAAQMDAIAITTDQAWARVSVDIEIELARS